MGVLAHTQVTFGQHVHVGVQSGDEAVAITNHLLPYVPVIIALSANSPFWRGYDTGHAAYRHRILASSRSYGIPPAFNDWRECSEFLDHTLALGVYESINDIHWDIRPRPKLGTVEIRLMDSQPSLEETNDLTAFIYCLVNDIARRIEDGTSSELLSMPHPWIQKENHFQAARLGVDGNYIGGKLDHIQLLRDVIMATLDQTMATAQHIEASESIERIRQRWLNRKLAYQRQQKIFAKSGIGEIVQDLKIVC